MTLSTPPPRPCSQPPFPEVTVILGDPRLPDVSKVDARYGREDLEAVERMKSALAGLAGYRFTFLDDHTALLVALANQPPQFVLNLCDTGFRNLAAQEPYIPALLEMLGVPYSGAPPCSMIHCYDKGLTRMVAAASGVPVPAEILVPPDVTGLPEAHFPAFVKPNTGDGSIGITRDSLVHTPAELDRAIDNLRKQLPGRDVLVQEFLEGTEYAIGLLGNPDQGFIVLPPLEVDYGGLDAGLPRILSYESKTVPDSPYWQQLRYHAARCDLAILTPAVEGAKRLFRRLGCRDYARFDFRTGADGAIKLLEVNPNPAWCWDGKLQLMARFAGYDETDLFALILDAAQRRAAAEGNPLGGGPCGHQS